MRNAECEMRIEDGGSMVEQIHPRSSILDLPSSTLNPRSSILDLRSSIFNPRSLIYNPQSATRNPQSAVLRMKLVGANHAPKVVGLEELPGKSNYFAGRDPKRWRAGIPTYAKVKYEG